MKKIWSVISPIVYSYLVQFLACIAAIFGYVLLSHDGENLNFDIIYKYLIIAITITIVPISLYILKKNYRKEPKINLKKLLLLIPLGFGLSWLYNMLTINFQPPTELMDLNIIIIILYTVILGPIFEEILFRYLALRKAESIYSHKNALLIVTATFALLHSGLIGILYAFLLGLILGRIYQKEKNILYPIVLHISANLASIFVTSYNSLLLIISICLLGIYFYLRKIIN